MNQFSVPVFVVICASIMIMGSANEDYICHTGYLMDKYCINLGYFLDKFKMENKTVVPLENAPEHSIHCLIEAKPCRTSGYEILAPPLSGSKEYVRKYSLNTKGNDMVVKLGCEVGVGLEGKGDKDCTGNTTDPLGPIGNKGFKPTVIGKLTGKNTTSNVPILDVSAVYHPMINCEEALKLFDSNSAMYKSLLTISMVGVSSVILAHLFY